MPFTTQRAREPARLLESTSAACPREWRRHRTPLDRALRAARYAAHGAALAGWLAVVGCGGGSTTENGAAGASSSNVSGAAGSPNTSDAARALGLCVAALNGDGDGSDVCGTPDAASCSTKSLCESTTVSCVGASATLQKLTLASGQLAPSCALNAYTAQVSGSSPLGMINFNYAWPALTTGANPSLEITFTSTSPPDCSAPSLGLVLDGSQVGGVTEQVPAMLSMAADHAFGAATVHLAVQGLPSGYLVGTLNITGDSWSVQGTFETPDCAVLDQLAAE